MVALRDFKPCYNFGITESGLPNQLISGYFQGCSEKANQLRRKLGTLVLYNHSFFFEILLTQIALSLSLKPI